MPTNLPAEARHKLAEYQSARTIEEKIEVLKEALSLIPDHKGTEKLRRQLRKRLAELRDELEERRVRRAGGGASEFSVKKEGWVQAAFIGITNSGKSSLLQALTGAPSPVADYPFTTQRPFLGMMNYSGCEIQLVDLPSLLTEEFRETGMASKSIGVARNSDLLIVVLDASRDPVKQFEAIESLLEEYGITLRKKSFELEIEKKDSGGLRMVIMGSVEGGYEAVKNLVTSLGIKSAVIKISGDVRLDELEEELIRRPEYKRSLFIVNKSDLNEAQADRAVKELEERGFRAIKASAHNGGVEQLKQRIFEALEMIRVYTRREGQVSEKPLLLKRGATVYDLAEKIHREFAERLKYARVWGSSAKIQGERVGHDHVLMDGDIVEIHL
ncbi:MAG: TGS domain-containing protein [Nitrososphaerota archaeon]